MKLPGAVATGAPYRGDSLGMFDFIKNARDNRINDEKDGPAFCGPMNSNHRNNTNTRPRNWLCLDIDGLKVPTGKNITMKNGKTRPELLARGISNNDLEWLKKEISQYSACFYLTHSDEPNPTGYKAGYGRKVRFVIMMEKDLDGDQWETVAKNFGAELEKRRPDLKGCIDGRSYERSQLMYTCPKRNRDSFLVFDGTPLNPDKYLLKTQADNLNKTKEISKRNYTAAGISQALPTDFKLIDPVLEALQEKGLYIKQVSPGKHAVRCPFGDHEQGAETSTVYMEPGADNEGVIYKYGAFKCMHDTCGDRKQAGFFAALGIDYNQYRSEIDQALQAPDCFQVENNTYTTAGGIVRVTTHYEKKNYTRAVFPEIEIIGNAHKEDKNDCGKVIRFTNKVGRTFKLLVLDSDLTGKGDKVREELTAAGLQLLSTETKIAKLLCDYIYFRPLKTLEEEPERLPPSIIWTSKAGWLEDSFIISNEVIGPNADRIFYKPLGNAKANYDQAGKIEDWRNSIAYCAGYAPPLMLALSAAFAAPLIPWFNWLEQKSGGFHFYSTSTAGKTTLAIAAAGVYGKPTTDGGRVIQWSGTANSIEHIAAAHNNSLLCLDELKTAKPFEVADVIYRLANSTGKTRLDKEINLRPPITWLILWLSTGEQSTTRYIESVGTQKADAGTEMRSIPIEADMGTRAQDGTLRTLGIFERVPDGMKTINQAFDTLDKSIPSNYGVAGDFWIRYITENKKTLQEEAERLAIEFDTELQKKSKLKTLGSQQRRQLNRFKLCAIGGELATTAGITGWDKGEAIQASIKLFARMLEGQTTDTREFQRLMERFQKAAQEEGNFAYWYNPDTKAKYGFMKFRSDKEREADEPINFEVNNKKEEKDDDDPEMLIFYDEAFENLCGNDHKKAAKELALRGILIHDPGRLKKAHKVPRRKETIKRYTIDYKKLMNYGDSE